MLKTELRLPEVGFIVGTRGMLGAGIGLLLAPRLSDQRRKRIGRTLLAVGVLTTLPMMLLVYSHRQKPAP